jgi:hypothetical protein
MIELNEGIEKKFLMKSSNFGENMPEILAQCQFCFKVKLLKIHCRCHAVSYCSNLC